MALSYTGPTTITISPASLATSSTFVAGRESTEVNNTSDLFVSVLVQGIVTVGTTPTIDTKIHCYLWGSHTSLATATLDVLDGTDSAETITSAGMRDTMLVLAATAIVDATASDRAYYFKDFAVESFFDGVMPQYWGLFLTHNTGVNLNSTGGNHVWKYTGVKY